MRKNTYGWILGLVLSVTVVHAGQAPLQIVLNTRDGSTIKGTVIDRDCRIKTTYAEVPFWWSNVRRLDVLPEGVRISMENRDVLNGTLHVEPFEIHAIIGAVFVSLDVVESAVFTPLIMLDGGNVGWRVETENVKDWSFENKDGTLRVDGIVAETVQQGGGGQHSRIDIFREVQQEDNFVISTGLNWQSENDKRVMMSVYLFLFDAQGERIASAGYHDAWSGHLWARSASVGPASNGTGKDGMPCVGDADVIISRHDGVISILWDDKELLKHESDANIARVQLTLSHYANTGLNGASRFGSLGVDYVKVSE